jgi:peptide/nickel transport system substrate-binding protein
MNQARTDCAKAKAEGAPIDRKIELYAPAEQAEMSQVGQVLQSEARKLGLDIEIVPAAFTTLIERMKSPDTTPDMWVHWVSTYFVDPENWIGQMYDSKYQGTWKASSWYKNPEVDRLLDDARTSQDQHKRQREYEKAFNIIVGDAVDIWVYNTIQLRGISDRVKGFSFNPVSAGAEFRWMSIADKPD